MILIYSFFCLIRILSDFYCGNVLRHLNCHAAIPTGFKVLNLLSNHLVDVITLSDWIKMHTRQSSPAQGRPPSCCSDKPWRQSSLSAESSLLWKHQSTGQAYIHLPQSQCYPRDLLVLREVSGSHRRHLHRFRTFHHSLTIGTRNLTVPQVWIIANKVCVLCFNVFKVL